MDADKIFLFIVVIFLSAIIAMVGRNRKIGFGWSFVACLILSPVIGLFITIFSEKNNKIKNTSSRNISNITKFILSTFYRIYFRIKQNLDKS